VVWIYYANLDFNKGRSQMDLRVEENIFSLNGDVTSQLKPAKPFVFGMNKK
jgi:hypothetical protein